jgi:hypothetical protein
MRRSLFLTVSLIALSLLTSVAAQAAAPTADIYTVSAVRHGVIVARAEVAVSSTDAAHFNLGTDRTYVQSISATIKSNGTTSTSIVPGTLNYGLQVKISRDPAASPAQITVDANAVELVALRTMEVPEGGAIELPETNTRRLTQTLVLGPHQSINFHLTPDEAITVTRTGRTLPTALAVSASACPQGSAIVGGGQSMVDGGKPWSAVTSMPVGNTWQVTGTNVQAQAVCTPAA